MKQAQNNFRKDRLVKMKKGNKIIFVYAIVTIMIFLLCGCQSKSKTDDDKIVKNDIKEEIVSDEQITEEFDNGVATDNKHNSLDSDSEQSYFNDETNEEEKDTPTSNSNKSNNTSNSDKSNDTSKPSTHTGNSKPSTNTQNTQSSTNTNNSGNNSTTNKSEENNNTSTNTNANNSTPSTSTETSKPTETTPEQPKGTLIYKNIYGCGNEHTKVVKGVTFHWYDRYERRNTKGEVFDSIDFNSFDVTFVKETDPLYDNANNNRFYFDFEATTTTSVSLWLRLYDEEGYFLEEEFLTNSRYGETIQGKCKGSMWCKDSQMWIDGSGGNYPAYVHLYPTL